MVLGRAVAHEIGHYLLRTQTHAQRGLMRAAINAPEFADPQSRSFRLDEAAQAHLAALAARGTLDDSSLAPFSYRTAISDRLYVQWQPAWRRAPSRAGLKTATPLWSLVDSRQVRARGAQRRASQATPPSAPIADEDDAGWEQGLVPRGGATHRRPGK